ncbi:hypothetical protein [Aequorivita capsosiphonis]|nr:hypothetical protein [Aequorivita capsosiphonis]
MKKKITLFCALLFIMAISSCTPEATADQEQPQNCCGDDGNLPPPPFG